MAILPLIIYPDPQLRKKAKDVIDFDKNLHELLNSMTETMYASRGIGLAACQVGSPLNLAVIDIQNDTETSKSVRYELINPTIIVKEKAAVSEEGCLSIPEYRGKVKRALYVKVEAFDRFGKPYIVEGEDLLSFCIQHEIDHLNGILFVDHLSRLKRELFEKGYLKKRSSSE